MTKAFPSLSLPPPKPSLTLYVPIPDPPPHIKIKASPFYHMSVYMYGTFYCHAFRSEKCQLVDLS